MFFVPRDSYYVAALRALTLETPSFKINDESVEVGEFSIDEDGFRWFESGDVLLQKGWHTLSIAVSGNETILDQIVMISNIQAPKGLEDISSSSNPSIGMREDHTTLHKLSVFSEEPAFVVMLNSYHPSWNAYVNGQNLSHYSVPLNMYWANLYIIDSPGETLLEITFDEQNTRNILIIVWTGAWLVSIFSLIYLGRINIMSFSLKIYQTMKSTILDNVKT